MSEILTPQGLESAGTLSDTDVQEVYQPLASGIRKNKQTTLATLKAYFFKLTTFTGSNIVEADGTGNFRTTGISTSDLTSTISQSDTNALNLETNINQPVKSTSEPIFVNATIGGHSIDSEITTLNNRVNQGVNTTDTPEFADVNITGLTGTVEDRIETNTTNISSNDSDIATLVGGVSDNANDISTLGTDLGDVEGKVGQSLNPNDDVEFNTIYASHRRSISGYISDNSIRWNDIYSGIVDSIPSVGDTAIVSGSIDGYIISYVERISTTEITFHGSNGTDNYTPLTMAIGTQTVSGCVIAW